MIALDDLLAAGGRLHGAPHATTFADWSYDSRLTTPGACFIALRTTRADGHDYVPAALAAGATGVLCRWPPADPGTATVVLSADPQALLQRWAAARLAAVAPQVIGVTGSVGKTTTRRAITAVLATLAPTFQSRRSFNSLLGLPIALARLETRHRFAVLEYGSDRPGEIGRLAALFPPRIAVVTSVGETHLRGLGDLNGVAAEKGALVAALPSDGVAVLNGDDPRVRALGRGAPQTFLYGLTPGLDLWAEAPRYALDGTRLRLQRGTETVEAWLPLLGEPAVYAALAATAAGLVCGLDLATCAAALAQIDPPAGRLRPLPASGGAVVLDDTFSATAPSVRAALRALGALPARRRLAVLGPLSDLPPEAGLAVARELGALAARYVDGLICKGDWGVVAAQAARAARPCLPVSVVDTSAAAINALPDDLGPGDLILVKGGAEARMERIVARLVATGAGAPPPLVRQEPVWHSVRVGAPDRPTWLRIDLDAIAGNVRRLCALAGVPLMAVLKGDGYGHGAVRAARAALGAGAAALAVATLGEGRALRQAGIGAPILVLGYLPPWQAEEAVALGLECALFDADAAEALHAAALARGRPARVHVKVDTGMARLGLPPAETGPFLARLRELAGLEVTGIYTHFAGAEAPDLQRTEAQLAAFTALLRELTAAGLRPPTAHAANSAALLRLPAARLDMVRPGIACYGLAPGPAAPLPEGFCPALSFHSEVAQVRDHPPGTPISYGGAFVTDRPCRIATIPAGYADGLRRAPPWREVLIRGRRAPIVGRICMDYAMVDVTDIPGVRRGDAVVLIGAQGPETISAEEVAAWLGTINYEVVTGILPRVPREVGER
ncbi:MAG: alanine racemase [Chloroflexaceae bacterium]